MADEAEELGRVFNGTIAARRINGVNHPFLIRGVQYSKKECIDPFKDLVFSGYLLTQDGNFKTRKYLGTSLNLNPDICGARNYNLGVVYSFILPIKQYRWGWNITTNNVEHVTFRTEVPAYNTHRFFTTGLTFVFSLINPNFPTPHEACSFVLSGEAKAVAFGDKWFVSRLDESECDLFYRSKCVGVVKDQTAYLRQDRRFLTEELSQFMEVKYGEPGWC